MPAFTFRTLTTAVKHRLSSKRRQTRAGKPARATTTTTANKNDENYPPNNTTSNRTRPIPIPTSTPADDNAFAFPLTISALTDNNDYDNNNNNNTNNRIPDLDPTADFCFSTVIRPGAATTTATTGPRPQRSAQDPRDELAEWGGCGDGLTRPWLLEPMSEEELQKRIAEEWREWHRGEEARHDAERCRWRVAQEERRRLAEGSRRVEERVRLELERRARLKGEEEKGEEAQKRTVGGHVWFTDLPSRGNGVDGGKDRWGHHREFAERMRQTAMRGEWAVRTYKANV